MCENPPIRNSPYNPNADVSLFLLFIYVLSKYHCLVGLLILCAHSKLQCWFIDQWLLPSSFTEHWFCCMILTCVVSKLILLRTPYSDLPIKLFLFTKYIFWLPYSIKTSFLCAQVRLSLMFNIFMSQSKV